MASTTTEPHAAPPERIRVIQPGRGWIWGDLRAVWQYRELLQILIWRNTIVRYKQSVIGIGWALIQPVTSMIIFSVIFGRLAKLPSDGVPYPIFTYVALLPWQCFASCLNSASSSLVSSGALVKKVYFPRLVLPLSNLGTGLVDFCISFTVLIGMMFWYRADITVTWGILCLPLFLFLAVLAALAVSLWLSALMVKYRDVQHLLRFITQMWMYVTPVAYASSLVPEQWRLVYALNPMVGVINGFRWALLGRTEPHWGGIAVSAAVTLVILVTGVVYFRKTERILADIV